MKLKHYRIFRPEEATFSRCLLSLRKWLCWLLDINKKKKCKENVEKALAREIQATSIVCSVKGTGAMMQRNITGGAHLQGLCYVLFADSVSQN